MTYTKQDNSIVCILKIFARRPYKFNAVNVKAMPCYRNFYKKITKAKHTSMCSNKHVEVISQDALNKKIVNIY